MLVTASCVSKPKPKQNSVIPEHRAFSCSVFEGVLPIKGSTQSEVNRAAYKANLVYKSICPASAKEKSW